MKETQVKRNDALVSDVIVMGVRVMWSETPRILETVQKNTFETEGFPFRLETSSQVLSSPSSLSR